MLPPLIPRGVLEKLMASYQQPEAGETLVPYSKRQQLSAGQMHSSPQSPTPDIFNPAPVNRPQESGTMPPPLTSVNQRGGSPIKTPRPDISIGIDVTALTSALSSQGFDILEAQRFLRQLQNSTVHREPDGPQEPMLISTPSLLATDLAFPFTVVEGKAYSTGKQVFEAENQAAVAGACGLKIQPCLDELVKKATCTPAQGQPPTGSHVLPTPPKGQPALFFSICTEGPIHELWGHWADSRRGLHRFHMKLLRSCHAVLLEGVEDFIVAVDNVLRWGAGPFLESVVDRLGKVAGKMEMEA